MKSDINEGRSQSPADRVQESPNTRCLQLCLPPERDILYPCRQCPQGSERWSSSPRNAERGAQDPQTSRRSHSSQLSLDSCLDQAPAIGTTWKLTSYKTTRSIYVYMQLIEEVTAVRGLTIIRPALSPPGRGSCFHVELRFTISQAATTARTAQKRESQHPSARFDHFSLLTQALTHKKPLLFSPHHAQILFSPPPLMASNPSHVLVSNQRLHRTATCIRG